MRKLLALTLSLLMVFSLVPAAMVSAETVEYSYVALEDFESIEAGTNFAKGKGVSTYYTNGWNGNGSVVDTADYLNPETGSTHAYKAIQNKLGYNDSGAVIGCLKLGSEQLANSYGFRFYVKGGDSVYKPLALAFSFKNGTKTENYQTNSGVSVASVKAGTWVTVMWGNADKNGLNWYHNGTSKYAYEVPSASTITSLSSLQFNIRTVVTANEAAQTFYFDDFQLICEKQEEDPFVDVTIDGVQIAEVERNGEYTIPTPPAHSCYTDGTNYYYGGEVVAMDGDLVLTTEVEKSQVVYTMDEGSRIIGKTVSATPGDGVYKEVDGDWVLALPSRPDQRAIFILPEDWHVKANFKAINISFSISRTSGAAAQNQNVRFAEAEGESSYVSVSEGYSDIQTKYTVAVDESVYGYKYFKIHLKGGSNFDNSARDYIYIDDVTITYEYDFDYVEPEFAGETTDVITTQDKAAIRLDSAVQGIRFYTSINLEGLDVEEVGTLIGPSDLAGDYLTMEDEKAGNAVKVEYDLLNGLYDGKYVVGSLVGIKEKNWARDFSARAYVILKDGTVLYSASTSTRNLAYIADAFIVDTNSNYNTLDAALKASVDAWAAAND